MRDLDKFRGCLIGGAIGDALGYAVEFEPAASIFRQYGEGGIREYDLHAGRALISDDTQMALFTAAGLLSAATAAACRGGEPDYTDGIARSYQDWYRTQLGSYDPAAGEGASWLANVPELYSRRAPGSTCMSALSQGGRGTPEQPINHSKGCGGIMRVAPVGIYFADRGRPEAEVDRLGAAAAALTHGHELGYLPAAMLVHMLQRLTDAGDSLPDAVESALAAIPELYPGARHMQELTVLVRKAVQLSGEEKNDLDAIRQLGEGWVAEETLAIAVYCALKYPDNFEKAIIASVNHDGDSDSTGAVTGNLLGAVIGYDKLPQKFLEHLELRDVILEVAEDLCRDCQPGDLWLSRYLNATYRPPRET